MLRSANRKEAGFDSSPCAVYTPRCAFFLALIHVYRVLNNVMLAISTTLEAQHASFIALANKTAALDASLQKVKAIYTQLWRAKTGSMRDPFNELDRGAGGEFGLEGLSG